MSEIRADKLHNVSGDNDSGIDLSTNDVVAVKTADTERMRVDASGNVGIGTNSPDTKIQIKGSTNSDQLTLGGTDNRGLKISTTNVGGQNDSSAIFNAQDTESSSANSTLIFQAGGTELMRTRLPANGGTMIGKTSTSASVAGFQIRTGVTGGNNIVQNSSVVIKVNRQSNDGELIAFLQANNQEGSISVSGGAVSYNAFSASHWSRLSDNSKPTILKGTVIETIDEMCDWYQAEFTMEEATEDTPEVVEKISIALPDGKSVGDTMSVTHEGVTYDNAVIRKEEDDKHTKCKISDTADSTRVYGVFANWDNDDDAVNDMYVTAVGTHVVRVHSSATVSAGDLLVSNGDGTAKVQDDDIIRSKTIGKVLTNIKQETYSDGSYTVPCALYCG